MKQSHLFTKTRREAPKDEVSKNAQLLIRGGFVNKELAGAYAYLPLGIKVINKISNIIREEMDAAGGQELTMTALQEKEIWEKTNRWSDDVVDNWFKTKLKNGTELGLGFTHEEAITRMMKNHTSSYKDLPVYPYQIQTKFRNESRAKSGLMRGREFLMKDLYSFSRSHEEHELFYEKMKDVYMRVFDRLGMGDKTYITISSGGSFSKYSYEFQTLSEAGEDVVYIIDEEKRIAINKDDFNEEVLKDFGVTLKQEELVGHKSIEVGDIYNLGHRFSEAFNLTYKNEEGKEELVVMGSYGMSPSRLMGAIVELNNDDKGIMWPEAVSPFAVHLISLGKNEEAEALYNELRRNNIEVLYDDRDAMAGEKFADADLIGISARFIISNKSLAAGGGEFSHRATKESEIIPLDQLAQKLKK
ncbi:His/Gly/Thr/Pro-type tRNA ligase C-terminal domain-containing protein [Candidatus Parcubacteria bacterium]|nr:prolyl-tRNA synthetase [Patescibacteria group bacterium]MBU4309829.1 prolyl-tRNA synthetase [Patescibacteria group bacterium]MBU4432575.1 prolyl-tRNA synthetase [Patescibacteria group bacterium]MBU4578168.1 prolyl-tRNA synthetase [Patescibacteria group bacterium]MCG2696705.1 His/Gly/Thr/Pro-type tRNA ligase C-terminal domain-containing protein [Candidatus Parcubacteria bacterium]